MPSSTTPPEKLPSSTGARNENGLRLSVVGFYIGVTQYLLIGIPLMTNSPSVSNREAPVNDTEASLLFL